MSARINSDSILEAIRNPNLESCITDVESLSLSDATLQRVLTEPNHPHQITYKIIIELR